MRKISRLIDLTDKIIGNWKVVKRGKTVQTKSKNKYTYWVCECQCGSGIAKEVSANSLNHGKSNGCKECTRLRMSGKRKGNVYDLSGVFGIGYTSNTNKEFYFDLEDYDKIEIYTWREKDKGYIETTINGKPTYLHKLLVDGKIIDHINRKRYDNRKENLRPCNNFINSVNKTKQSNNTSGIIGVWWDDKNNKWYSVLVEHKKSHFLGRYINKEEAIKKRLLAELKYFGEELAPQKHLFEEYNICENSILNHLETS